MSNPPLVTCDHSLDDGTVRTAIRDDVLFAGTKQRAAHEYVRRLREREPDVHTLLYTGAFNGYGPVAAACAAQQHGLKALLLLDRHAVGAPPGARTPSKGVVMRSLPVTKALKCGATIELMPHWGRLVARGKEAAAAPGVHWLPLGMADRDFHEALVAALIEARKGSPLEGDDPARIWVVGGVGALAGALAEVFAGSEIAVVSASASDKRRAKLAEMAAGIANLRVYDLPREAENMVPPYPSVQGYDSRAWAAAVTLGADGDFVWNVAHA